MIYRNKMIKRKVKIININVILLLISFVIILFILSNDKFTIQKKFDNEINTARDSKIINELLLEYESKTKSPDFFFKYFKPIAKIDKFKSIQINSIQFVFAESGKIMHIQKATDLNKKPFDFRLRNWYQCAKSINIDKGYCLSNAYYNFWYPHESTITYSYPIYYSNKLL